MKFVSLFAVGCLLLASVAGAHSSGPKLPPAGSLPGSFGHRVELFFEGIADSFVGGGVAAAKRALERVNERLSELDTLAETVEFPDPEDVLQAGREYLDAMRKAGELVMAAAENEEYDELIGRIDLSIFEQRGLLLYMLKYSSDSIAEPITTTVQGSHEVFRDIIEKLPETLRPSALEAQDLYEKEVDGFISQTKVPVE